MANICDNTFYASGSKEDIQIITNFLEEHFFADIDHSSDTEIEAFFDSKWTFPEQLMRELYEKISNKNDIYMRCLSVELGCLYHAIWVCDEDGWTEV